VGHPRSLLVTMASLPVEYPAIDDDVLEQMTSIAIEALIEENRSVKRPTSEDDKHFIAWSKRMRIYKRAAEAREEQEVCPSESVTKQQKMVGLGFAKVTEGVEVVEMTVREFSKLLTRNEPATCEEQRKPNVANFSPKRGLSNSAPPERLFSILNDNVGDDQLRAKADYKMALCILPYNDRDRD
jgi:hypothetical protein